MKTAQRRAESGKTESGKAEAGKKARKTADSDDAAAATPRATHPETADHDAHDDHDDHDGDGGAAGDHEAAEPETQKHKEKLSYEASLGVEEAIAYFDAILKGLRKGSLEFRHKDSLLELTPRDRVDLEVKASRKGRKEKLTFELSWTCKEESKLEIE